MKTNPSRSASAIHPGKYIRSTVFPKRMTVTNAAKLLGVGRLALSNLLNGNASLSSDMAARLERTFGASAKMLMDIQATYDAITAKDKVATEIIKSYVSPFLQIKANDIESWSQSLAARSRLAVFLRTLVNSTGQKLTKVEFPGNDDSQRPGWDGYIESEEATPWIPLGKSGWEFGVNADPQEKAENDYQKSLLQNSGKERKEIVFVFVTPRRWLGKGKWEKEKQLEKHWKDVRAYDASNLEEWLEQSIPAQTWFANEQGIGSEGVLSLDACWKQWIGGCQPTPTEALFSKIVGSSQTVVKNKFSQASSDPTTIAADSVGEAQAFLHCLFSSNDPDLFMYRDRIAVFTQPGILTKVASRHAHFIAVVTDREIEKELAQYKDGIRSIIIYPRNTTNAKSDIVLEPLSYEPFDEALRDMGFSREDVQRLSRESGRSLTILRRRLSSLEAVKTPVWASEAEKTLPLIPFLFAGTWRSDNLDDQWIIELLAHETRYDEIERNLALLLPLEDAPVWSAGAYRGLVSKIDTLFAIHKYIIKKDLDVFFEVAKLVLSEDDPSLDLPEDKRWAAGAYKKVRNISSPLREGIAETLVLLSIHGNAFFYNRLGMDLKYRTGQLIREILTPLTLRNLEANSNDLPLYAEAAPQIVLELLEADISSEDPQTLKLMRPVVGGIFGRSPRTGLLWALESLAWTWEYLPRVVRILGFLSGKAIDDNWANKPIASLQAIFRYWMPQTSAPIEKRMAALDLLIKHYPKIGWIICYEQFNGRSTVGNYSHKPRWRTDGYGYGNASNNAESHQFARYALEKALNWKTHNQDTIADLLSSMRNLGKEYQDSVWSLIEKWSETASEEERGHVREKIRTSTLTSRALRSRSKKDHKSDTIERAKKIYDMLEPTDLLLKHEWLFRNHWVDESANEANVDEFDYRKREERIRTLRKNALLEVYQASGIEGILKLSDLGETSGIIGWLLPSLISIDHELLEVINAIFNQDRFTTSPKYHALIRGMLSYFENEQLEEIILKAMPYLKADQTVLFLTLCPFKEKTWGIVNRLDQDQQQQYWTDVPAYWSGNTINELHFAVEKLLEVFRPVAAFNFVHLDMRNVQPRLLCRILDMIASDKADFQGIIKLEPYSINEAFEILTRSGEIPIDEMAGLEFKYIEILEHEDYKISNLERHIEKNPESYVQLIMFAYRRNDGEAEPEEFNAGDTKTLQRRGMAAYKLLEKLSQIPGKNHLGELDANEMEKWVRQVRGACNAIGRLEVCDLSLGKLFSNATVDEDGIWPFMPVRDALERVITDSLANGLTTALYNARGVHWRGEGGDQERELTIQYKTWAEAMAFTHPRLSQVIMRMAVGYEKEADWQDVQAVIRKRISN